MMATDHKVVIIGGGLCGLACAIALEQRSIPYHIYEARSSFTEIGAGINIGPNTLKAFEAIDPSLGDMIFKMCSRNAAPKEDVWMQLRYGAPTARHGDYELITELMAPPTGNMAAHRNDLLQLLASRVSDTSASFNKKVIAVDQDESGVTLRFADGSSTIADVVIACDGIHSSVRRAILDQDDPASVPQFAGDGAYRAMIPVTEMQAILGEENGQTSQILLGPNGYLIMYSVAGGENMNVGLWMRKADWTSREWVRSDQRAEMLEDLNGWGETVHKIMDKVVAPSFWATHCHTQQPANTFVGRVCLIGDSAHSMPPHQGAGAGQSMEDAYVLAEVLSELNVTNVSQSSIQSAFAAFEAVRKTHSEQVLKTSVEAMQFWSNFHQQDQTDEDVEMFKTTARKRFAWIWNYDVVTAGQAARTEFRRTSVIRADVF